MSRARSNFSVLFYVKSLSLVLTIARHNSQAYNVDFFSPEVFRDPRRVPGERRSYFGFSVALYANARESLLLVGAPRANSSALPQVTEPGTVFKCAPNNTCREWLIDKTGNGLHSYDKFKVNQMKDNAWIGATIAVGKNKEAARIVVCGPRWINTKRYWYMNGICYATLANNTNNALEREAEQQLLPLLKSTSQSAIRNKISVYNYGMGQTGFSLHMNSLRGCDRVALGSPGVYNWKGDAIQYTATENGDFTSETIPSIAEAQQVSNFNYFGYAITAGDYFYEQDTWYASSAPRGAEMVGKVLIFRFTNNTISMKREVYGKQFGEYFGAALTSCDINNDGRDELIVGAPLWSKHFGMDEGRVYIFTVTHKDNFEEMQIEGEIIGGRFGSAVTCLGDIDYDGYGDIAVGAPYEEENSGAIYIFNGNDIIPRKYSQRLAGSTLSPTIRGFGIAISEPRDIDRDNHPDIAVGAYLSDEAVLLKSVPVVTVNVALVYPQKIKLLRNATSFVIHISMSYDGSYVPDTLRVTAILKIDQQHARAVYREQKAIDRSQTYRLPYTLLKYNKHWSPLDIYLIESIQNIIDPLEVSVSVQLQDDLQMNNRSSPCFPCVAINKLRSKLEDTIRLPFALECGKDDVCVSDLSVALSTDSTSGERYVIGAETAIALRIHVQNRGEPAYQAKVHVFIEVLPLASIPPECVEGSRTRNILEVICEIGNPLRTSRSLTLHLDTSTVEYDVKKVEIRANISTQSDDANWNDNSSITLYFDVGIDIAIVGKAQKNLYWYSRENTDEPLSSIRFQHFYEVQKFGVGRIDRALLTVRIPTHYQLSDTEHVTIASINDTVGRLDGREFYCDILRMSEISPEASIEFNEITSTDYAIVVNQSDITSSVANNANFSIEENATMSTPSENRTLYINCTNEVIDCAELRCALGPFVSSLSVARFLVTLDLQLSNFSADMMKDKDIIFYVTEGAIKITDPSNIIQRKNHKPDATSVATTFLGSPVPQRIAVWIVAVSVFLGIVLLLLVVLGLIKLGFFNRKKKQELEAMKTEAEEQDNAGIETSFSTEGLNQD